MKMGYMTEEQFQKEMNKIQSKNKQIEMKEKLKNEKNKYKKSKKVSTSNKVLLSSIIAVVIFTIACLYIQCMTMMEVSSTLITLWYSFWTVEIVSLAGIKITKVIRNYDTTPSIELDDSNNNIDVVG